ncbi:MAG: AraC family transcriptional regulator [Myxococcota bacterium]
MDPLSDIFQTLRVRSSLYFRAHLTAPWGLEVPAQDRVARFHIVLDGSCLLGVEGKSEQHLQRGDLAVVPRGAAHTLRADEASQTFALATVLDESAYDGREDLYFGGEGSPTVLVCGHFAFDDNITHPVIDALPAVLHIRATEGHDFRWLDGATQSLGAETRGRPPGWEVVASRVSEILFVQILRAQIGRSETPTAIAAFSDPQLSHALRAIHEDPQRKWNVEALARRAAMSRTAFAVRFREHLGTPPMAYITQWRLQKARIALVDSDETVASIAIDHGYQSEAAFSRAFQRLYGKPPATYRRDLRDAQLR